MDACNILYDDTAWRRWLLRILFRLGLHTNYTSFFRVLDQEFMTDVYAGRRTFGDALASFLLASGLSPGQTQEVKAACLTHRRSVQNDLRLLTGVRDTLGRLHGLGITLGVLCNSEHSGGVVRERLECMLPPAMLASVLTSRDLERAMPDAACYGASLDTLGLPAGHVAFVGHDAGQLAGAAAAGLATIAFNGDPDAQADVHIGRFEDLIRLVSPCMSGVAA